MSGSELASHASADLLEIVRYTHRKWGDAQTARYREELELALQHLSLVPDAGRRRDAIAPGLRSFAVAEHVAFYVRRKGKITILRILHPRMNVDEAFETGP
jgi:toxin ParE1/3/4